ncbi:MAG: DUF262 domain-containing protein, partial [Novosphingobium sp.]|nr:DUF262 domain-containing protein [Novosphingobium sp.]
MAASVDGYLSIVSRASRGELKLPAFQRDWKWNASQVILLLDSLRQGFPIGSFLFIQANPTVDLAPRAFRGAGGDAEKATAEELVLDGQQRITAGLELFYGGSSRHYFLDLKRIRELATERDVIATDKQSIRAFLADLDAEDGYCVAAKASVDPHQYLLKRDKLWTGTLLDDDELARAIQLYAKTYPAQEDFIRFVVGRNFMPAAANPIPITTIPGSVTVEAISRIFSTLNSTGKMLTPFELVVSILYPKKVNLQKDVEDLREMFPYYARIDKTGDLLLQAIALFSGKETRKASLPKTITLESYREHRDVVTEFLEAGAKLLSDRLGLGLDESSDLLVYPVIFPPLAFVLKALEPMKLDHQQRSAALRRIERWFVGAVISRRYQQSTHDKQAKDKVDILKWAIGNEQDMPEWLRETYVTNLRSADPSGAMGSLLASLMNARDADSDDAAHPFRSDRAHRSDLMPPGWGADRGPIFTCDIS